MFKRATLNMENWNEIIPYLAFAITAIVFVVAVVWAFRMKDSDVERNSRLPLDLDDDNKKN